MKKSKPVQLNTPDVQRLNIKIKPKENIFLFLNNGTVYHLHNLVRGSKAVVITITEVSKEQAR